MHLGEVLEGEEGQVGVSQAELHCRQPLPCLGIPGVEAECSLKLGAGSVELAGGEMCLRAVQGHLRPALGDETGAKEEGCRHRCGEHQAQDDPATSSHPVVQRTQELGQGQRRGQLSARGAAVQAGFQVSPLEVGAGQQPVQVIAEPRELETPLWGSSTIQ